MKPSASNCNLVAGFSPEMLIDDARTQAPELAWLPEALARCGPGTAVIDILHGDRIGGIEPVDRIPD